MVHPVNNIYLFLLFLYLIKETGLTPVSFHPFHLFIGICTDVSQFSVTSQLCKPTRIQSLLVPPFLIKSTQFSHLTPLLLLFQKSLSFDVLTPQTHPWTPVAPNRVRDRNVPLHHPPLRSNLDPSFPRMKGNSLKLKQSL